MSQMRELTDKELDTVCGGKSYSDSFNWVSQSQEAYNAAAAFGGNSKWGNGGNATVTQTITQTQTNTI